MRKSICTLITIVLLTVLTIPAFAAGNVKPVVTVFKYNDATGNYDIPASTATQGDLLLVRVAFSEEVQSLASLRVKLEFSADKVSFVTGSFTPELVSGDTQAGDPVFTAKDKYVVAFFGKSNFVGATTSNFLGGASATNIASFIFSCTGNEGMLEFKATIDNAMDAQYGDVALAQQVTTTTVALSSWELSVQEREVFEKLETITYAPDTEEDSKVVIDAADKIYEGYTAAEKVKFKTTYPELFENYRTAWTRYYDASVEASQAAIQAEVERFVAENQAAFAITSPEQVNTDNYQAILDATEAYGKLTGQAQVKALKYKEQLDRLSEVASSVETMVQADADAFDFFINPFMNTLWNIDETAIDDVTYSEYMTIIADATAEYNGLNHDNMSAATKAEVAKYYEKLMKLSQKVTEVAKKAGEDAAIQEEITAFTEKWHVVTRLTALTVGVDDKTAIEMMLEDFAKLSEIAQQRLASRKSMAEQLLTLIGGYSNIQGSTGTPGISVVPNGGTTQEVIKEVQVPVETLVTQTQYNSVFRNVPTIVYIMILLMVAALLTTPIPIVLYLLYRKKANKSERRQSI